MKRSLVPDLVRQDWYVTRGSLALIAVAGALSVGALRLPYEAAAFMGMIGALMALILLGILLPFQTIVHERKQQRLAFVMSLPVSPMEYTAAKMVSNLAGFSILWLAIAGGALATMTSAGELGGLIPLGVVSAGAPFVAFCVILAVAIVAESEPWAIVTQGACNVSYSFAWFFVIRNPRIRQDLQNPVAIWSEPILWMLAVEIAVIVLAIGGTFYFQSRKTDFI